MKINLSIFGRLVQAVEGTVDSVSKTFDWVSALGDAAFLSGITFFGAFGGSSAVGVVGENAIVAAVIAAGAQFCTVLALKRGLVKEE
jgi:hypothetical protein